MWQTSCYAKRLLFDNWERRMMSNFRNVSKKELCPICGKPDWCTIQDFGGMEQLHYCRRSIFCGDIISQVNGQTYIFIKQAADGSCIYKDQEHYETSRDEWFLENAGYKTKSNPKNTSEDINLNTVPPISYIQPLSNQELDTIYRSFLKKLTIYKNHIRYLRKERWTTDLIMQSRLKSLPLTKQSNHLNLSRERITLELIKEFGSLKGVPGFYMQHNGKWSFAGSSGILIPLYDCNHYLFRLRIRLDHPEVDENGKEKNKYHNFSSFYEIKQKNGTFTNAFKDGSRSGSHCSIYTDESRDDFTVCYITEGEKKAIYANYVLHAPIISIPGVNSFQKLLEEFTNGFTMLDYLKAKGCRFLIIAYDADKFVNRSVLMYEKKLIEFLKSRNFSIGISYWNPGFGKGLDDILSIGVRPNYELITE